MKILQTIHSVNPRGGGPIEGIRQLIPALASLGIHTEVMSLDSPDAPWTADFPVPLHALGPSHFTYGYSSQVVPWLKKHRLNYDAVIVNGVWQYSSFAVWRALHGTSTPYYVYPHGMLDPWFKRRYPLKHLKKCFYWPWAEYRVLRDATAVLFTSEEEKLEARKSFYLYRCREEITGYGIASPSGNPSLQRTQFLDQYRNLKGKSLILFLGRIHEKKGCDLLLHAWKESLASNPAATAQRYHLVMAGPSDNDYGRQMKRLSHDLGLDETVTWAGMITGDVKWGSLHASSAFILPSHQENFGISVVEALVCGVPVLISNQVNIWREIQADYAGMVEPDTLNGTIALLNSWFNLEISQKEAMQRNAVNCFSNRFHIGKTAAAITNLLRP